MINLNKKKPDFNIREEKTGNEYSVFILKEDCTKFWAILLSILTGAIFFIENGVLSEDRIIFSIETSGNRTDYFFEGNFKEINNIPYEGESVEYKNFQRVAEPAKVLTILRLATVPEEQIVVFAA